MAMTTFRLLRVCGTVAVLGAAAFAWAGLAAAQSKPRVQTNHAQQRMQYQQNVRQQQLSNQLRDNRISEQQRQRISDSNKQPYTNDATTTRQIQQADQARQNDYQSHQQNALDSYESAVTPRPAPAKSSSGDKDSSGGH